MTVYEDNSACLLLASTELPRTTPHSKHFATKYHWWFQAKLKEYKTKGLRKARFEELRKLLMGW